MSDGALRDEINKRFTLNWLIQGAAQHAGMTLHHLIRDEINAIDPRLLRLYDQFALINLLQYWQLEGALLLGRPRRFWKRASTKKRHPFFNHAVLSRHGGTLAAAGRQRALDRCKEKGLTRLPIAFSVQTSWVIFRISALETRHQKALINLAKQAAAMVWGISSERFEASLTSDVAFGSLSTPKTMTGWILRAGAVGYGGVLLKNDALTVVGKGANWYLLTKELVKGTAELICMHGLNDLDDTTYERVMSATDRIDFEPWMLQTGGELWRRLLAVAPDGRPMAEVLMHMARLPAQSLESLMLAVLERPDWARDLLRGLGQSEPAA